MIWGEDKKHEIGQVAVTLLKKAAKLIKERRLDISNLKVVGFDEADTFFKSETD